MTDPAEETDPQIKSAHSRRMTKDKRQAMETVIALVSGGSTVIDALRQVGRSKRVYAGWRQMHPDFRHRMDQIRSARRDNPSEHDFPTFRNAFFANDTPPHHHRMIDALQDTKQGQITMILAFPEAAKTSLAIDRINFLLGPVDPDYRIAVISEGATLAGKVLHAVQNRMTDRVMFGSYINTFGPFRAEDRDANKPWNATFMSVLRARNDEKEYSLEARGAGAKLYGGRYDWLCLDDIQSSETLNATSKLLTYIRTTVLTRPTLDRGYTSIWGSRVGDGDIYERLIDEDMVDHLVKIPALTQNIDREEHYTKVRGNIKVNPNCSAQPTWDRYSLKQLAVRRDQVKETIWARTYMQSSLDIFGATFSEEMLERVKDPDRKVGQPAGVGVMCSVDPALESGICAYVACAYDGAKLWVLDTHQSHDTHRTEDILDVIADWSRIYRPKQWIIEQNNFQKGLVRDDRLESLSQKFGFEISAHQTSRNKYDSLIGIKMMASSFLDDEIVVPWHEEAREKMAPLIDELRSWRPNIKGADLRQDLVVALWFIWIRWQAEKEGVGAVLPHFKRPSWLANGRSLGPLRVVS